MTINKNSRLQKKKKKKIHANIFFYLKKAIFYFLNFSNFLFKFFFIFYWISNTSFPFSNSLLYMFFFSCLLFQYSSQFLLDFRVRHEAFSVDRLEEMLETFKSRFPSTSSFTQHYCVYMLHICVSMCKSRGELLLPHTNFSDIFLMRKNRISQVELSSSVVLTRRSFYSPTHPPHPPPSSSPFYFIFSLFFIPCFFFTPLLHLRAYIYSYRNPSRKTTSQKLRSCKVCC